MSEDEIKTSVTDRMTLIAQGVCEKLMLNCSNRENEKIENLEGEVEQMKVDISAGFTKIENSILAKEEKKDSKVWDIIQILVSVVLTAVVVLK